MIIVSRMRQKYEKKKKRIKQKVQSKRHASMYKDDSLLLLLLGRIRGK